MNEGAGGAIIYDRRDALQGRSVVEFKALLRDALAGRVMAAYLFGSYAIGTQTPGSDVDLIIVADTDKSFVERAGDYFDLYDIACPIDILVYRPEEFERLTAAPTAGFWQDVCREMQRIL